MMTLTASWLIGGNFRIYDEDNGLVAELKLYEPLKSAAIDDAQGVATAIIKALGTTPHPYAKSGEETK